MNFTEPLLCWGIITHLYSTTNQYVSTCVHTVGSHTSVATCSKVVQYWRTERVRQFYSNAIPFCLTPPTAALYLGSLVMFILLFESHFVTWSLLIVFLSFATTSSFLHPCSLLYPFYYSSLYTQGYYLKQE